MGTHPPELAPTSPTTHTCTSVHNNQQNASEHLVCLFHWLSYMLVHSFSPYAYMGTGCYPPKLRPARPPELPAHLPTTHAYANAHKIYEMSTLCAHFVDYCIHWCTCFPRACTQAQMYFIHTSGYPGLPLSVVILLDRHCVVDYILLITCAQLHNSVHKYISSTIDNRCLKYCFLIWPYPPYPPYP
jgi:hypothetical protein